MSRLYRVRGAIFSFRNFSKSTATFEREKYEYRMDVKRDSFDHKVERCEITSNPARHTGILHIFIFIFLNRS